MKYVCRAYVLFPYFNWYIDQHQSVCAHDIDFETLFDSHRLNN